MADYFYYDYEDRLVEIVPTTAKYSPTAMTEKYGTSSCTSPSEDPRQQVSSYLGESFPAKALDY